MSSTKAFVEGLTRGRISLDAVHLCVDMQRVFSEPTPWTTPWMESVRPRVHAIASAKPARTIFTRFITAAHPGDGAGVWADYWTHWSSLTRANLDPRLLELLPELDALTPPAQVVDKYVYSPWRTSELPDRLTQMMCRTLVVTGGESDVCVLASVLGAVDRGYRVVVVTDALCSSSDETHDAVMTIYGTRYGHQIELVTCDEVLEAWE